MISSSNAAGDKPEEGKDEGEGEEVKQQRMKTWETRSNASQREQRLLCQLRYFGELHFSSNNNTNKYINITDYHQKLFHQIIHPLPDAFLSNIQSSPLQPQCCDVSLWIIPLTEGRSNAAAAAKHRTAPAPRVSRGSRARWSRHLCSPRDPTELGSHIYGLVLPPSSQTLDQQELWLPPRSTGNETVLPRVDKPA